MTFEERRRIALVLAARAQLSGWTAAPHPHRLLWRLGVRIPPPHFAPVVVNALVLTAIAAAVLFPLALRRHSSVAAALLDVLPTCALTALAAALAYRYEASTHGLPAWKDVQSEDQPVGRGGVLNLRG